MTSSLGCVTPALVSDQVIVSASVPAQVSISSDQGTVICNGQQVTVTAIPFNGGVSPVYEWLLNGVLTGDTGMTYSSGTLQSGDDLSVQMISSSSCASPLTAVAVPLVFQVAPPLQVIVFGSPAVCEGEQVDLAVGVFGGDGGPYDIRWNGVSGGTDFSFFPTSSQTVTIAVQDGCSPAPLVDTTVVIVYPRPVAGFAATPSTLNTLNPTINLTDTSSGVSSLLWFFGDGDSSLLRNPVHTYGLPGNYTVTQIVSSPNGCVDTVTFQVVFTEDADVWFPNSFTPNGDLVNDSWLPIGIGLGSYRYFIYNRWGGIIFEGDESKPWPGTYKDTGNDVQQGVYTWLVILDKDRFSENKVAGQVTLIRMVR
jgi:gliding motility-associated-like protein